MTSKITLGQAIDQINSALEPLDQQARTVALQAVCNLMNIKLDAVSNVDAIPNKTNKELSKDQHKPTVVTNLEPSKKIKDIRSLKDEKKPSSAQQMACLVAYYLSEIATGDEKSETVSTPDLEKYFKQGGYKLPEDIKQVLKNAKNAGYFESSERGKYKLNAVGYNLVTHGLPASTNT